MNNREIFREARKKYFESGKLLCAALGFCIVLFSAVMALVAADVVNMVLSNIVSDDMGLALYMYGAIALVLVFVTVPAIIGYFGLLYSIYNEEREIYLIDIFKSFSPKRYFKTVFFGIHFLLRGCFTILLPLFIAFSIYLSLNELMGEEQLVVLSMFFKAIAIVLFLFFHLVFSFSNTKGMMGIFYRLDGAKHPYKESKKALSGRVMRTFWLKMMFFVITVISVLSLGMLFLVTVPIMANAYFIYAKQITENINE